MRETELFGCDHVFHALKRRTLSDAIGIWTFPGSRYGSGHLHDDGRLLAVSDRYATTLDIRRSSSGHQIGYDEGKWLIDAA